MKKGEVCFFIIFIILLLTSTVKLNSLSSTATEINWEKLPEVISNINITKVNEHILYFSSLGTRYIGTQGFYKAAEYIKNEFIRYKLKPGPDGFYHIYLHTDTVENYAELEVNSSKLKLKLLTLHPNLVETSKTPPNGIEGKLLLVEGNGSLSDFDGKDVKDRIVVMSYDSGSNWLNAAKLGAKAVIFLSTNDSTRFSSLDKFIQVPLYFPRYYASANESSILYDLARNESYVRITCNMHWDLVNGINVLGILEGSDPKLKNEIIVVSSHFDSWSPIPELAPGAEEASGISVLLEIARILSEEARAGQGPRRTIWFVALSGNWQVLAGARNFVMDYLFSGRLAKYGEDWPYTKPSNFTVYSWISLDFSTGSKKLGILFYSLLYRPLNLYGLYSGRVEPILTLLKTNQREVLRKIINAINNAGLDSSLSEGDIIFGDEDVSKNAITGLTYTGGDIYGGLSFISYRDYLESEPALIAGVPAVTLRTIYDYRPYFWTLEDTPDKLKMNNLTPQAAFALGFLWALTNVPSLGIDYESRAKPTEEQIMPGPIYTGPGMSAIRGNLQVYNSLTDRFSDFVTNETGLVVITNQPWDPRSYIIAAIDRKGNFIVKGLESPSLHVGYAGAAGPSYSFYAFVLDNNTGLIKMANLGGTHTIGRFTLGGSYFAGIPAIYRHGYPLKIPVYEVATIVLFDAFSPYTLSSVSLDPVFGDPVDIAQEAAKVVVPFAEQFYPILKTASPPIDVITGAENEFYSSFENEFSEVRVVYVTPGVKSGLRLVASDGSVVGLLVNSTKLQPLGNGFVIDKGKELRFSVLEIVKDFLSVNSHRISTLEGYKVVDTRILELHSSDEEMYKEAETALSSKEYSKAYSLLYASWLGETYVYKNLILLHYDITSVTVFFASLLLPFAYLFEKVIYGEGGFKSFALLISAFAGICAIFALVHPGFLVASSPITIIVGFAIFWLLVPFLLLFFEEMSAAFREIRRKLVGKHEEEISRLSQIEIAISIGAGYMKKRPLRTGLTMFTLVVFISSLTVLTAMSTVTITQYSSLPGPAGRAPVVTYDGIQIKRVGLGSISERLIEVIKIILNQSLHVDYQVWYYPNFYESMTGERRFEIQNNNNSYYFQSILGLTENLIKLYKLELYTKDDLLKEFQKDYSELPAQIPAILPKTACEKLGIKLGDKFMANGLNFILVGEFDDKNMDSNIELVDIDQDRPTPIDLTMFAMGKTELEALPSPNKLLKLSWSQVMLVPAQIALRIGGTIRAVSLTFPDSESIRELLLSSESPIYKLIDLYNLEVVIGSKETGIKLLSRRNQIQISGLSMFSIPITIIILIVLDTFLASMYEKMKEMKVFSAVGLSPTGVTGIVFTEALVYALLSAVIGYVMGTTLSKLLLMLFPTEFTPNYSSAFIVVAIGLSLLVVLLSSLYPAIKASTLITPSLERKWKIPTKPSDGTWEVPLPFYTERKEEAAAILYYLKEYLDANSLERSGSPFATISTNLEKVEEGFSLKGLIRLAPFESGLVQISELKALLRGNRYEFVLELKHKDGPLAQWKTSARTYIGIIRNQLLLWRGLLPREKEEYMKKAGVV